MTTNYKMLKTFLLAWHFAAICRIFPFICETHTEENYKLQSSSTFTSQHSNYTASYVTLRGNMTEELFSSSTSFKCFSISLQFKDGP